MKEPIAMTRGVSERLNECELTHIGREPIDLALAIAQHEANEQALRELGARVLRLAPEHSLPDCVFVEDTAVVLEECAIITRPGTASRRAETHAVRDALGTYRRLHFIAAPATLEGGDVLCIGRQIWIGMSTRSNPQGVRQLRAIVEPLGYRVHAVPLRGCLHLKSAVTQVAPDTLLINPGWVERSAFEGMKFIPVDPAEPAAANALLLGDTVIYPAQFPATRARLGASGIRLRIVDASEVAKAEGAVTCCSIVFDGAIGAVG